MATEPSKRLQVAKKVHIAGSDGSEHRSAHIGQAGLELRFLDTSGELSGQVIKVARSLFSDDMWSCAAWHGLAQKLGDTYADAKKKGLVPFDEAESMLEQIVNGNWVAESLSTGPRIGLLLEAIVAAKAKADKEVNEDAIREKLKDKEFVKSAKAVPEVDVEYQRIVAERAVKRAKEAAKTVKDSDAAGLDAI